MIWIPFCKRHKIADVEYKYTAALRSGTKQLLLIGCIHRHPVIGCAGHIVTTLTQCAP